jgi:hypothetical protein
MRFIRGFAVVAIYIGAGVLAPAAPAAGGSNIASAPTVTFGQQEFGNTVTDGGQPPNCAAQAPGRSWWLLPVVRGDSVTIDLAGQTQGGGFLLQVFAPGTTDSTVGQTEPWASNADYPGDQFEVALAAPSTGTMPIEVSSCDSPGTYSFTAYVQHSLVVALRNAGSSRKLHRSSFALRVRSPDGTAVSTSGLTGELQTLTHGRWVNTRRVPLTSGFQLHWPRSARGRWQYLRVRVSGPGYATARSNTVRIRGV